VTPEIIFEVLSLSTKNVDRNRKYNLFQENGVKYYIIVEPKGKFAEVYRLENGFYRLQGAFTSF
jgi:Uma2 family endonuclease